MKLQPNIVDGIHRIEDSFTNWYLIEQDHRLTIVDTGVPTSWASLHQALAQLGHTTDDVEAIVLTHAHFDHVGFAERAREAFKVQVYVHENDVPLTQHPWRYDHERARAYYLVRYARALPIVVALVRNRALWPPPLKEIVRYENGTLPVPGEPRVIFTPGHTHGHCALHLPERDVVIAGDAIVTLDPYTAHTGPRIVAGAATVDSARNLASLNALSRTGARTVLVGHGEPWTAGVESAVERARAVGAA